MLANSAWWRDLQTRFRQLPNFSRMAAVFGGGEWGVTDGCSSERDTFESLAAMAGNAAGVSGLDGWLNLLRDEGLHFYAPYGSKSEGGWIPNPAQASVDYCGRLESRAFGLETAAAPGAAEAELPEGGPAHETAPPAEGAEQTARAAKRKQWLETTKLAGKTPNAIAAEMRQAWEERREGRCAEDETPPDRKTIEKYCRGESTRQTGSVVRRSFHKFLNCPFSEVPE